MPERTYRRRIMADRRLCSMAPTCLVRNARRSGPPLSCTHTHPTSARATAIALLRAAHLQGCHVYFEYPVVDLSKIEDQYVQLCQELASHCTRVRLWQDQHSVIICSTDSSISKLASHSDGLHALSGIAAKHCTSLLQAPIKVDALPKYMSPCYLPKRPAVCDGAGMFSTADHSANNTSTDPKPLAPLAHSFKRYLASHGLIKHISSHLSDSKDEPPLSEEHGIALASIVQSTLAPSTDLDRFLHISEGQPFRLNVLQSLAQTIQDRDAQLPIILDEGCPQALSGHYRAADNGRQHRTPWISRMTLAPHRLSTAEATGWPQRITQHCSAIWYRRKLIKVL